MTREEFLDGLKDIITKAEKTGMDLEDIISDVEDLIEEYNEEEEWAILRTRG